MGAETFQTLIDRNKRNSVLLVLAFLIFFVAVGTVIGWTWGGGDWTYTIGIAIAAAALAFVLSLLSYYGGSSVLLAGSGAKEIVKADDPQLFNVVEELSLAGGTPIPRIFLIDEPAMNAFATGRDPAHAVVAITRGLREKLTREELQGVLGHELSHVRHYDIRYATLIAVLVGTLVILCDIFLRSLWWGGGRSRRSSNEKGGGGAQVILLVIALVLAILAPILAKIIQMAISRQREFMADAGSVELTRDPRGLASALAKLAGDDEVLQAANRATAPLYIVHPIQKFQDEERSASIFDTHPPIRERIARLIALEQ